MKSRMSALALVMFIVGPIAAHAQDAPVDSLALARQYTSWLYAGEADSLVASSTESAREGFSTHSRWTQYAEQISRMAGEEVAVLEESWKLRNGDCQYYRLAAFSDMEDFMVVRWIITKEGRIGGVGVGPAEQTPPFDRESCP
ncbi:MAG: hypothetical protein OEU54_03010 [Gemmatimonadota bacterium]|nr:hypothetical protein [Gemmatimonadota bacterium]